MQLCVGVVRDASTKDVTNVESRMRDVMLVIIICAVCSGKRTEQVSLVRGTQHINPTAHLCGKATESINGVGENDPGANERSLSANHP